MEINLRNFIYLQSVKPIWERTKEGGEHFGWVLSTSGTEEPGADPDPINGAKTVRELYEIASSAYTGKYTVPVGILIIKFNGGYPCWVRSTVSSSSSSSFIFKMLPRVCKRLCWYLVGHYYFNENSWCLVGGICGRDFTLLS
jgi:hypothetical protein